jgi:hypothetical protein
MRYSRSRARSETSSAATGFSIVLAPVVALLLSLGYDMTQPLFAGIVTSLGGKRPGQAMGLNVLSLFVEFGLDSLVFGVLLRFGFGAFRRGGGGCGPGVDRAVPVGAYVRRGQTREGVTGRPRCLWVRADR